MLKKPLKGLTPRTGIFWKELKGTKTDRQIIWIFYKEQAKKESMWPNLGARLCPFLKDWPNPTATGHPKKHNPERRLVWEKMFET